MSSSVYLNIYTDELRWEDKSKIKDLMKFSSMGDNENSEEVAEFINENISDTSSSYFAYWNFRKGQDIEPEEVIEHFKTYGLLASKFAGRCIVSADPHDTMWMYDNKREYPIYDDDSVNRRRDIRLMELRKKVKEGQAAEQKLRDFEPQEQVEQPE